MAPISVHSELLSPNYKDYIEGGLLRRMSKILRMSVACAKDSLQQAKLDQPDSIVVGTGLGCLQDTEKFLNTFLTVEGLLPPTSFIQSTHNTIAGQISLSIGNHGYNMTHTQNTLSFEHALIDTELLLQESDYQVLVGAADEHIDFLDQVKTELDLVLPVALTSGASFFVATRDRGDAARGQIVGIEAFGMVENIHDRIGSFLDEHKISATSLDLVLFAGADIAVCETVLASLTQAGVREDQILDYLSYSGIYPTSSAFALHLALDQFKLNTSYRYILVCNCLNRNNLGLILVESVEA